MNGPKITAPDLNEVVKSFQNEAGGDSLRAEKTQGYFAEVNLPCKCPWAT